MIIGERLKDNNFNLLTNLLSKNLIGKNNNSLKKNTINMQVKNKKKVSKQGGNRFTHPRDCVYCKRGDCWNQYHKIILGLLPG